MFQSVVMSNSTCVSEEPNISSGPRVQDFGTLTHKSPMSHNSIATNHEQPSQKAKKKRNLPGNPDPDAEVIALSPTTLLATNRFVCEICNKGFQRDQNLQLHRRGHNLPWKLKQRNAKDLNKKRAYVCPEATCVHHHPSRALGDLTGIKKHYCRKHGEKKWKCDKCSKIYAVQSDWKAHSKTCGTREYRCDCGTIFSRKDSFITHRAFCDALAEESARISAATITNSLIPTNNSTIQSTTFHFNHHHNPPPPLPSLFPLSPHRHFPSPWDPPALNPSSHAHNQLVQIKQEIPLSSPVLYQERSTITSPYGNLHIGTSTPPLSATALLQKAATVGLAARHRSSTMAHLDMHSTWHKNDRFTRDFLGLTGPVDQCDGSGSANMRDQLFKHQGGFEFAEACPGTNHWGNC